MRVTPATPRWRCWLRSPCQMFAETPGRMAGLRVALPPPSQAMNFWLEGLPVPLDMDHVAFFAGFALAMRLLLPPHAVAALAVGGGRAGRLRRELLQLPAMGATPRQQDARDDLIGGGIVACWWARCCCRRCFPTSLASPAPGASIGAMTPDANRPLHCATIAGRFGGREGCTPGQAIASHGVDAALAACEREVWSAWCMRDCRQRKRCILPRWTCCNTLAAARPESGAQPAGACRRRKIQRGAGRGRDSGDLVEGHRAGQWLYPSMHLRDIADNLF